jgi:hypothetical protein
MSVFINSRVGICISVESIAKQTFNFQYVVTQAIDSAPYVWDDILNDLEDMAYKNDGKVEPADFDLVDKHLSEVNAEDCIENLTREITADTSEDCIEFEVPFEVDVNKLIQLCRNVTKK